MPFDGVYKPAGRRRRFLDLRRVLPVARQDDDPVSRDLALRLLGSPSREAVEVDRMLSYAPTQEAVDCGRNVIFDFLMSDEMLDNLNAALGQLLRAAKADDGDWVGLAATWVADECNTLMREGFDPEVLGRLLEYWGRVTPDAPAINVTMTGEGE